MNRKAFFWGLLLLWAVVGAAVMGVLNLLGVG